jgi:alcohol dehydrogenase (cytochrome c)
MKCSAFVLIVGMRLCAQGLDPAALLKPPPGSWPTYNGDYSGRRYSTLAQIDKSNVASLKMAWAFQTRSSTLKSTPLEVNGVLYFTAPDHVWAIDARNGRSIWHYSRPSEGNHIASAALPCTKTGSISGRPMPI